MRVLLPLALAILLTSCGATVAVDYEKQTDWNSYTTYQLYPDIDSGLSELDNKRIARAIDSAFYNTPYQRTSAPKFLVNFYAKEFISDSRNTVGIGLGGGGGNVGVGGSLGIPIGGPVIEQQITIDFVDSEKDQLLWQAVIDCKLKEKATPEQRDAHYIKAIGKALKKFPPQN